MQSKTRTHTSESGGKKHSGKRCLSPPKVLILLRASLIFQEIHMLGKCLFLKEVFSSSQDAGCKMFLRIQKNHLVARICLQACFKKSHQIFYILFSVKLEVQSSECQVMIMVFIKIYSQVNSGVGSSSTYVISYIADYLLTGVSFLSSKRQAPTRLKST